MLDTRALPTRDACGAGGNGTFVLSSDGWVGTLKDVGRRQFVLALLAFTDGMASRNKDSRKAGRDGARSLSTDEHQGRDRPVTTALLVGTTGLDEHHRP